MRGCENRLGLSEGGASPLIFGAHHSNPAISQLSFFSHSNESGRAQVAEPKLDDGVGVSATPLLAACDVMGTRLASVTLRPSAGVAIDGCFIDSRPRTTEREWPQEWVLGRSPRRLAHRITDGHTNKDTNRDTNAALVQGYQKTHRLWQFKIEVAAKFALMLSSSPWLSLAQIFGLLCFGTLRPAVIHELRVLYDKIFALDHILFPDMPERSAESRFAQNCLLTEISHAEATPPILNPLFRSLAPRPPASQAPASQAPASQTPASQAPASRTSADRRSPQARGSRRRRFSGRGGCEAPGTDRRDSAWEAPAGARREGNRRANQLTQLLQTDGVTFIKDELLYDVSVTSLATARENRAQKTNTTRWKMARRLSTSNSPGSHSAARNSLEHTFLPHSLNHTIVPHSLDHTFLPHNSLPLHSHPEKHLPGIPIPPISFPTISTPSLYIPSISRSHGDKLIANPGMLLANAASQCASECASEYAGAAEERLGSVEDLFDAAVAVEVETLLVKPESTTTSITPAESSVQSTQSIQSTQLTQMTGLLESTPATQASQTQHLAEPPQSPVHTEASLSVPSLISPPQALSPQDLPPQDLSPQDLPPRSLPAGCMPFSGHPLCHFSSPLIERPTPIDPSLGSDDGGGVDESISFHSDQKVNDVIDLSLTWETSISEGEVAWSGSDALDRSGGELEPLEPLDLFCKHFAERPDHSGRAQLQRLSRSKRSRWGPLKRGKIAAEAARVRVVLDNLIADECQSLFWPILRPYKCSLPMSLDPSGNRSNETAVVDSDKADGDETGVGTPSGDQYGVGSEIESFVKPSDLIHLYPLIHDRLTSVTDWGKAKRRSAAADRPETRQKSEIKSAEPAAFGGFDFRFLPAYRELAFRFHRSRAQTRQADETTSFVAPPQNPCACNDSRDNQSNVSPPNSISMMGR